MRKPIKLVNIAQALTLVLYASGGQALAQGNEPCTLNPVMPATEPVSGQLVQLVVGDDSLDGHEKTYKVLICSNKTDREIQQIERASISALGFNYASTVASDYDDSKLKPDQIEKLRRFGVALPSLGEGETTLDLDIETYTDIYLQIIEKTEPAFSYRNVRTQSVGIGGYGLFQ